LILFNRTARKTSGKKKILGIKMWEIKFGLKLWSTNSNLLKEAKELIENNVFQYIEVTPIPNTEMTSFLAYNLPYIIHITTERHGLNIADKEKEEINLKMIYSCIEWADKLNAKYLILHPGYGPVNSAIEFLDNIKDKRILIENMPKTGINDEKMVGYTPEQINRLVDKKFELCLDLNHAIKAAISLNKDYKQFVEEFLELNPKMFHISDGKLNNEKDEHLNIGDGDYDFGFLATCVKKSDSKYVTLETPRNLNSFDNDINNLKKLINLNTFPITKSSD
jgi:deoxyribonuclease-4